MNGKTNLSIKDIARLSGVSAATVSHVLNKKGRYSKETEEKVNRIIMQYGYRMNNAAKSLKSSASHTVGLIVPSVQNEFFASIATRVEQFFDRHDYSLFICNTDNDPEKEIRYFKRLDSMQVDGIICISCQKILDSALIRRDVPVVLLDRLPLNNLSLHKVHSDAVKGIHDATEMMVERGCRNIIFVSSYLASYTTSNRISGYLQAMHEHDLHAGDDTILQLKKGVSMELTETGIIEYLKSGKPVDAVICTSDNQALGAIAGIRRMGLCVPGDIKVIGFDNQIQSRVCSPTLSTIERNPSMMAEKASEILFQLMNGKTDLPDCITLETHLIERESTLGTTQTG